MYAGIDSRIPSLWPTCQEYDEHRQQQREAEEMLRQTEEDADEEILQLKNKYEWQLRKRQEECTKMKGELGLQNKKVYTHGHTTNESAVLCTRFKRLFYHTEFA